MLTLLTKHRGHTGLIWANILECPPEQVWFIRDLLCTLITFMKKNILETFSSSNDKDKNIELVIILSDSLANFRFWPSQHYLLNTGKPLQAAGTLEDNARGLKIVQKQAVGQEAKLQG